MNDHKNATSDRVRRVAGLRAVALVAVMLAGMPLISLVFSTIAPILPPIASHFGPSGGIMLAQWVMTAPAIGLMIGGPSGGYLVDRLGVRRLIILSFAVFAVSGSAGLYIDQPIPLLISRFILGLSGACTATASTWLIGVRYDEAARRQMIGAQNALSGAAAMSAVLISGRLAAQFGWRTPFSIFLLALPLLACALVAVPAVAADRNEDEKASTGDLKAVFALWPMYLGIASIAGLMMMPATQVPFVLASNGVDDPIIRSQVVASSALLSIVTAALFPVIRARVGERGTMLLILGFYAAGTAMLATSSDAMTTAFACVCLGTATGLFTPHFSSIIIKRTEPAIRGRAIGTMFGAIFLSEFLSPLVVLPLRQEFGVHGGFVPMSIALVVAFLAVLVRRAATAAPGRKTVEA